jgi:hypothetical protein
LPLNENLFVADHFIHHKKLRHETMSAPLTSNCAPAPETVAGPAKGPPCAAPTVSGIFEPVNA